MTPPATPSPAPVWSKRVGDASVAAANIAFCAGYDVAGRPAADSRLAPHDLATNAAHLLMLVEEGIVPRVPGRQAAAALLQLRARLEAGEDLLRPSCEDIHMSVEALVGELVGPVPAGHLHTARSRNDQVATDMRLWLREEVAGAVAALEPLTRALAAHARDHVHTVCPGFTHGQPAMVTSWGHWTMSFLPRVLRDVRQFAALARELKTCPLGAAASFGTGWPIRRERTAAALGFRHPSPSGADAIWARGDMEGRFAEAAARTLAHLSGVAQDLILLSTPPRVWLRLADEYVTGSSIMPQKRNPDFAEVTRSRAHVAAGIAHSLLSIGTALPSGYNRDTQWTKYLVFDAADNLAGAPAVFAGVFQSLTVYAPAMRAACLEGFLNATDVADFLASSRALPFRACYKIIGAAVRECDAAGRLSAEPLNRLLQADGIAPITEQEWSRLEDPVGLLALRRQPGNPHPDETRRSIDLLEGEILEEVRLVAEQRAAWQGALEATWADLARLAAEG